MAVKAEAYANGVSVWESVQNWIDGAIPQSRGRQTGAKWLVAANAERSSRRKHLKKRSRAPKIP